MVSRIAYVTQRRHEVTNLLGKYLKVHLTYQNRVLIAAIVHFYRIVDKLEFFCSSGQFTQFLQEFGQEHGNKFNGETEEQSHECYTLWQEFKT
mgnify:CR=1 FL=1